MGFWQFATGGGSGGGTGDVVGPASSTDNAVARWDLATGKLLQDSALTVSDVAGGVVTLATTAGNALAVLNTAPAAAAGASVAGDPLTVTAGAAVASTDTDGAAAGGSVTITGGAAARRTSGNANGGDVLLVGGAGIGTGTQGVVKANGTQVVVGSTGATDNAILRADGTGGATLQTSGWVIDDSSVLTSSAGPYLNPVSSTRLLIRAGSTDVDMYSNDKVNIAIGGQPAAQIFASTEVRLPSGSQFSFSSSTANAASADTGLARSAAGVVKVTDGGAGAGSILVNGGATSASVRFGGSTAAEPALGSHASTSTGNVHVLKADVSDWTGVNASEFLFSNTGRGFSPGGGANTNTSIGDNGFRALNTAGTDYSPIAGSIISAKTSNGAQGNVKIATTTVNASGAASTATNLVPAGCILLGVTTRVTTAITSGDGGTSVNIGNGTDADMYGATIAFALGTTTNLASHTASALAWKSAAESVVFTCVGGTFNGGVWRVCAHYLDLTAPTS